MTPRSVPAAVLAWLVCSSWAACTKPAAQGTPIAGESPTTFEPPKQTDLSEPLPAVGGLAPWFVVVGDETAPPWSAYQECPLQWLGDNVEVVEQADGMGTLVASALCGQTVIWNTPPQAALSSPSDADGHLPTPVEDGRAYYDGPRAAGDLDGDGINDVWIGTRAFTLPIEGVRSWDTDWYVKFEDWIGPHAWGNFDADGDGNMDVALFGDFQFGAVHYGPFEEKEVRRVQWADTSSGNASFFTGYCEGATWDMVRVVEERGDLYAVMSANHLADGCRQATKWFSLLGARGWYRGPTDTAFTDTSGYFERPGDFDGDGYLDWSWRHDLSFGPPPGMIADVRLEAGNFEGFPGDFDGDGRDEILVSCDLGGFPELCTREGHIWLLPGTPDRDSAHDYMKGGVKLDVSGFSRRFGLKGPSSMDAGDLDGDGIPELVLGDLSADDYRGRLGVWRGSSLLVEAKR